MLVTKCPHTNRKHYAKNMCSSCYRKFGRKEYATKCEHTDRLNYSIGMCQTCYLADYHQVSTILSINTNIFLCVQRRTKVKRREKKEALKLAK